MSISGRCVLAGLVQLMHTTGIELERVLGGGTLFQPSDQHAIAKVYYQFGKKMGPIWLYCADVCDVIAQEAFNLAISTHGDHINRGQ